MSLPSNILPLAIAALFHAGTAQGQDTQGPDIPPPQQAQGGVHAEPLPATHAIAVGTELLLRTVDDISSESVRKGDLFHLELAEDYVANGMMLVPKGTVAVAEFTQAERKGMMGCGGKLAARALYLKLPDGPVRLSGELSDKGKSKTGLATVVTGLVGVGIFIEGKAAVIPKGSELVVQLDREVRIPIARD